MEWYRVSYRAEEVHEAAVLLSYSCKSCNDERDLGEARASLSLSLSLSLAAAKQAGWLKLFTVRVGDGVYLSV